jgi:hypothetical protein
MASPEWDIVRQLMRECNPQVYTNNAYAIDGCATFFKRSRFSLVKKYEVEFNKAALSLAENIGPDQKKPALSRLLKVCSLNSVICFSS